MSKLLHQYLNHRRRHTATKKQKIRTNPSTLVAAMTPVSSGGVSPIGSGSKDGSGDCDCDSVGSGDWDGDCDSVCSGVTDGDPVVSGVRERDCV